MGIVPTFNELQDRHARFDLGLGASAVAQFTFKCGLAGGARWI